MKHKNTETKPAAGDKSPLIPQRSKLKHPILVYKREMTEKQKEFLKIALDKKTKLMFVLGPAGTSKTFLAVYVALKLISERRVSDLIYVRSIVESADSKMGYLPGETNEKMAPYMQPLMDKLSELLSKSDIDVLRKEERFSGLPIGHLRGLNWNAKAIIADEAQNLTYKEMVTLLTRVGEFSKVFVIGDPEQSDINGKSSILKIAGVFEDEESEENGVYVFRFTDDDNVRSGLSRFINKKLKKVS